MTRHLGMPAFAVVAAALVATLPVAPSWGRHLIFLLMSLLTLVPVGLLLRRLPRAGRLPFVLLAGALGWLVANYVFVLATGDQYTAFGDVLVAVSNLHLLAAAVTLVLRRGRNDIGGLLDASVFAVVIAALTWTLLLQPRLNAAGVAPSRQITLLTMVLLLAGVLGALVRVLRTIDRRPGALVLFTAAVLVDLVACTSVIATIGSISTQASSWQEMLFLSCYALVGLAALRSDAVDLTVAGPAPRDRLVTGRVLLLGGAAAVVPMAAGIRSVLGAADDAALLIIGNLVIVVLVAVRVALLAREREQAGQLLRHQATHDLLTGLPNRAELWARLDAALTREKASGTPSVVLLFCDLNGFKQVNDQLGHLAGDRLLTEVAARIGAGLRAGETLARYGGDEFVLLGEDPAAAGRLADHVRRSLTVPVRIGDEEIRVGASVGSVVSDGRSDADELIRRADEAMYRDKQRSRMTPAA